MIWRRTENGFQFGTITYTRRYSLRQVLCWCGQYWPRRRRYRVLVAAVLSVLLFFLGPYVVSRALSSTRALQLQELVAVQDPAIGAEGDGTLRVVCYNIAHGRGLARSNWAGGTPQQREERLSEIADLLRELDGDVVVLNEVDFDASWSGAVDQAAYLAKHAGYPYVATLRNLDFCVGPWSWQFGNAVLSRHPVVDAYEIDLPGYAKWETALAGKKRALFCELDVGGRQLGVVAVHLSHRSETLRVASAQRLLDATQNTPYPVVLAGDFNSAPTGLPGAQLGGGQNAIDLIDAAERFHRLPTIVSDDEALAYTFRSDDPSRVIDWIFVSKPTVVIDGAVKPSELSDHYPVVAEIVFAP